jgi:hypothetical protein
MTQIGPYCRPDTFVRLDGRTKEARLMRRVRAELTEFVGGNPDVIQQRLIDRAVILTLRCAQLDAQIIAGVELGQHASNFALAWNNALRRTLAQLGIKPKSGEGSRAPPSLDELFGDVA